MNKKILILIAGLMLCLFVFAGCQTKSGNRITSGADVQTFNYAYVSLDGKMIAEGYVTQWRDYKDSEAVQVMIDGKYYLTEYTNVVLIADPRMGSIAYSDVTSEWNAVQIKE